MRRLETWVAPSEEVAASERLATLVRWLLIAFVLTVNNLLPSYTTIPQVNYYALCLVLGNVLLSILLWRGVRPSRALSLLFLLVDVAFIWLPIALAPTVGQFRYDPYYLLFFLIILSAAMRLGVGVSLLVAVVISVVYGLTVYFYPKAFPSANERDALLATRLLAFMGIGALGGILAYHERRQRRQRQEERQRSREREIVLRIASAISMTLDMDKLVEQVFASLQEVIPFSEGEITFWSGAEGCLVSRSLFTPLGCVRREARYAPGEGYSGWMAVHREPLWVPDVAAEKGIESKSETSFAAFLGVPLLLGDRLVGTLGLASHERRGFSQEDRDILVAAAPQIAVMVDHAHLYDRMRTRLERQVQQLSAIGEIDQELTGTLDLHKIIGSVLDRAIEFAGADSGALWGVNEQGEGLLILASRGSGEEIVRFRREPWPMGAGIVGRVARTRRPALVGDVALDPDYVGLTEQTRSELAVPVQREDEILGVLNLESRRPDAFDEETLEYVQHLAEHAAIAIHNARIFSLEQRRTRELAALQEVSLELSRQLDVSQVLRSVAEQAAQLLDATSASVYTADTQRGELELAVMYNMPAADLGTRLKLGEGLSGQVAQAREPRWVDDYREFQGRSPHETKAEYRAVIAVPLLYGDEVLGVLDVLQAEEGRVFTERDLGILMPLANQAAVAIANARLFEEARRWASQLAMLQEVGRTATERLGLKEALDALIQGVQRLIPGSEGEICLYNAEQRVFTVEAIIGDMARSLSGSTYTLDEGYTGWLGRNRRPLLIQDCASYMDVRPKHSESVGGSGPGSFVGVPMLIGERLVGTIELISEQPGHFNEEHLRLLSLVADQASVVIDNARLYELTEKRLRQRVDQLVALQRIGQQLNTTLLLEDNLRVTIEEAVRATASSHGNIAMYDESIGAFRVTTAQVGYTPEEQRFLRQLRLGRGRSMMDDVLRSGHPEIVPDVEAEARPVSVKRETRSALSVPVSYEGRTIGAINLGSEQVNAYSGEDLQFVQTLAAHVALAVGNARRYEELVQQRELVSQRATQFREILELGNTLRADRELPDILSQVAYGVIGSVGFGIVLFNLVAEDDPTVLERVASAGIPLEVFQRLQEVRPPVQTYLNLLREEFLISRSYFVPEHSGLAPGEDEGAYMFQEATGAQLAEDEWHPQDMLLVPMYSSGGNLLGIMSVDNPFDRKRPTRRVVEALEIFANQAAVAVENARLFREREWRINELNVLNRISQATTSTLDLDTILLSIYERLAEARILDVEGFHIAIYDAGRDSLRYYPVVDRGVLHDAKEGLVQGTAGWIVRHRKDLLLEDIAEAERRGMVQYTSLTGWVGGRPHSYLGVPMLVGDELVGIIAAHSYRKGAYGERERQFLVTVANQIAVAIQNARLFREREQRLAELAILNEVGRALSSALELDELLETVHQQVSRIFKADSFYVATYEEGAGEWALDFHLEHGVRQPVSRHKLEAGLSGHIIRNGQPVLLRSAGENIAFHEQQGIAAVGEVAKSWMGVPLIAADKVVGVMGIQSYERENLYSEQDLALFSTIAAQAAIAIDNARLFRERERRITELAILNEVGRALSSALERDQVTQAIYEQVSRVLDTTNFYIATYDEERREWETVLDYVGGERQPAQRYRLEQGLTGFMIRNRQPLLFHSSEGLRAFHQEQQIALVGDLSRSWMGVPMVAADRVVGAIGVESYELDHAYSEDDLAVLSTVAAQAAVALENARLFEETRRRLQQVDTLLEVSRDVATRLGLPVVLQSILEAAAGSVQAAERGSILLLDEEAQELVLAAQIGYPDETRPDLRFSLDEGLAGRVCREGRAEIVADAQADPRFKVTESTQDVRSIVCAPLIGRRGPLGVINLDNRTEVGAFGQADLDFLSGLAHQAAVAIENAGLLEQSERQSKVLEARVRELTALLEGTRAITSTLELQEVLETLVGVVGRQMEVATVVLWLVEGELVVPAAAIGLPESFMEEMRLRRGEGLTGRVAAGGEVIAISDVMAEADEVRSPIGAALDAKLGLHAYLGVPITYQDQVLGVLSVMDRPVRAFSAEEIALLTGLAEQAGIAVQNSRLFQERERRIAELTALNEVGRAISSTMRLDELLETIRVEAGRLMDTSNFLVALYDERSDTVSFPVYHEFGKPCPVPDRRGGSGLTEYVIRQRAPVLIERDTAGFCEERGIAYGGTPSVSWLGVPLFYLDRVIGIMALQDYEHEHAYDEHDVRLLSTIAGQAAVAIQNARLFSDLEASRTELETRLIQLGALQEMGQAVTGTLEIDAVLDIALEAVTATIGFSYAVISLVDEEAGEVRAIRGLGVSPEQIARSHRSLDSPDIMADVVRTGKTEVIDGWDERFDREMFDEFAHARLVRVFAPLVARGKVIGLIEAGFPKDIRATITADDIEILQTFLSQASVAIDNARLFAEIRRFTEELERMVEARTTELQDEKNRLEALHAITTELSSSLDLDEILLKTIDLASMATGRSLGMVLLRDPGNEQVLVCRAMLSEGNVLRPGRQVIPLTEAESLRRVLEEREPLCINDCSHDPLAQGLPELPVGARSVAAVPLVSAEAVVGVILLTHSGVGFFDEDQIRLLMTLGGEVATAIHNAELYSYINEQALRLSDMLTYQQEEASKVRAILQSIADGVIVVDREGRIILANPAAQQILGMSREQLEDRTVEELPGLFLAGGILAKDSQRFELEERYINVLSAPVIKDPGEVHGTVYVLRDITREVEADRAKSEFISTVSHELRTPLTSIKGYVDLILLGSVGDISPMQRNFLDVVRTNSNRLVELINDLLDISRIETGRIVLNREPISISDLVEEVVESTRAEIERKQLALEIEVSPDLPIVHADRKRIMQVLSNMVSNAYKYTREGGRISIAASSTDGYLQVSVSDTGVGISEADMQRLFTRFFRADNPLRDEVGGTGLGLAISKSFVEMHGGEMWAESELDVGSTFCFTLPLGMPDYEQKEEPAAGPGRPSSERAYRILVVDDEPHIADLLRFQLEEAGYRVRVARRGEEALEIARREHPDLITLDLLMAGMDGFEVLERLKADEGTADIPVLVISIVAERENLMAMGAVDFLPKPLGEEQLLTTIGRILGSTIGVAKVLVADDDPDIVAWLRRVLEEKGFEVQAASDGEAVLEAVVASPPDLILLDLRMPKLDGREVITRLKLREDTRDIPILVITASSVERERDQGQVLGLGAESFLTKPFTAEELVREMERVLRKRMEAAKE